MLNGKIGIMEAQIDEEIRELKAIISAFKFGDSASISSDTTMAASFSTWKYKTAACKNFCPVLSPITWESKTKTLVQKCLKKLNFFYTRIK